MDNQPPQKPQSEQTEQEQPKELSKKAQKKLQKEQEKAAKKAQQQQLEEQKLAEELKNDPSKEFYGDLEMIQSQNRTNRKWTKVCDIDEKLLGQQILVRARVHNCRGQGQLNFLVLRENFSTVQVVVAKSEKISKHMFNFVKHIPNESIVDITATVTKPEVELKSTSQKVELKLHTIFVITRSKQVLPFKLEDASRKYDKEENEEEYTEEEKQQMEKDSKEGKPIRVLMKTRLDNRIIDLRTPAKQAIFRLQSGICYLFREFLIKNDFIEIHTPKLIAGSSEGGANVFKLKYFDKDACLAQSPQLYKQMAIMSDFDRVFEIGPVFRAENSFTHRHMCEFTGLDLEMGIKEHFMELLELMSDLFVHIFKGIETKYKKELEAIHEQFPFEPFVCKEPVVKLTFREGCELLKKHGVNQSPHEDLDTPTEKKLGEIVKKEFGTDFYMLYEYPKSARPFYTMLKKDEPDYTLSYDFFMRGEEITSGAQRNHDPHNLAQRAKECGINVDTIKDYIESFSYGAVPHGGCGIGLERVLFLYCNMHNIRNASMFPRDPKRITP